ncbi:MAG: transporter [Bdellovibrionaceae bacterium]|nr:transporter [Pseudobdellovibrionaceae bacterium]
MFTSASATFPFTNRFRWMLRFFFTLLSTLLFLAPPASVFALDSAQILPVGIRSPSVRFGTVGGIGQKFTSGGQLQTLSDYHSIVFDASTLQQVRPEAQRLVSVLNQFGHQNLGDALNLGVLRIETRPEVRYMAPIFAYGLTERWTIAVGLPIIHYRNTFSMSNYGSNVAAIQAQVGHNVDAELNEAFEQLSASLVTSAEHTLADKGYKPLRSRNQTIHGDLQLAAIYKALETPKWALAVKSLVNLPTGPADDPDDLADLNIFGETALEEILILNYRLTSRWELASRLAYRWLVPDRVQLRVPEDANDTLPGAHRKERLSRDRGDVASLGSSFRYRLLPRFGVGAGYELSSRERDRYGGSRGGHYALLSRHTGGEAVRFRAGADYSTTDAYFAGSALLPMILSFEFSDTIAGRNVERQTIHELWLTLFF